MNESTLLEALHDFKRIYSNDKVSIELINNLIAELLALKARSNSTSNIPNWEMIHIGRANVSSFQWKAQK